MGGPKTRCAVPLSADIISVARVATQPLADHGKRRAALGAGQLSLGRQQRQGLFAFGGHRAPSFNKKAAGIAGSPLLPLYPGGDPIHQFVRHVLAGTVVEMAHRQALELGQGLGNGQPGQSVQRLGLLEEIAPRPLAQARSTSAQNL